MHLSPMSSPPSFIDESMRDVIDSRAWSEVVALEERDKDRLAEMAHRFAGDG